MANITTEEGVRWLRSRLAWEQRLAELRRSTQSGEQDDAAA